MAKQFRSCAAIVVAAIFLALSASAQTGSSEKLSSIKIENFGSVGDKYYRGAQPKTEDYSALAALGVKTVINLTSDDADANEQAMVENSGMKYVQIPMTTHEPPTGAKLSEFLDIVNNPANQPVFVHCVGGKHRTGVMTAVYRMIQDGWTADQAFKEMKQFKFGASFLHSEFKDFVYDFYSQRGSLQTASETAPVAAKSAN